MRRTDLCFFSFFFKKWSYEPSEVCQKVGLCVPKEAQVTISENKQNIRNYFTNPKCVDVLFPCIEFVPRGSHWSRRFFFGWKRHIEECPANGNSRCCWIFGNTKRNKCKRLNKKFPELRAGLCNGLGDFESRENFIICLSGSLLPYCSPFWTKILVLPS